MKRCPQCGREYDSSMMFCLDDGAELLYGPASIDEPATAILTAENISNEQATRSFGNISSTDSNSFDAQQHTASKRNSLIAGIVGIVLVTSLGLGSYLYYGRGSSNQINSIAVMPCVNDSGNPENEYLSDGITELLIKSLSQLPNLNVKSRSSVFRYKGKETDAKTIGNELNVQAVLNGRVIQRGNQLSLNLELIDAKTENVIWTDQYDRQSTDLVSLQNVIARDVSSKLKIQLSSGDLERLGKKYTNDPEAFRLYLQGRFYWNKRVGPEFERAESYFQ